MLCSQHPVTLSVAFHKRRGNAPQLHVPRAQSCDCVFSCQSRACSVKRRAWYGRNGTANGKKHTHACRSYSHSHTLLAISEFTPQTSDFLYSCLVEHHLLLEHPFISLIRIMSDLFPSIGQCMYVLYILYQGLPIEAVNIIRQFGLLKTIMLPHLSSSAKGSDT